MRGGHDLTTVPSRELEFTLSLWWTAVYKFDKSLKIYVPSLLLPFLRFCFGPISVDPHLQWMVVSDSNSLRGR